MSGDDNLWCPSCRAHHAPCAVPPPVADPIDTEREAREALAEAEPITVINSREYGEMCVGRNHTVSTGVAFVCEVGNQRTTVPIDNGANALPPVPDVEGGGWNERYFAHVGRALIVQFPALDAEAEAARIVSTQRNKVETRHLRTVLALLDAERVARQTAERERDAAVDGFHRARVERDEAKRRLNDATFHLDSIFSAAGMSEDNGDKRDADALIARLDDMEATTLDRCEEAVAEVTRERDEARAVAPRWERIPEQDEVRLMLGRQPIAKIEVPPFVGYFRPYLYEGNRLEVLTKGDDMEAAARTVCARLGLPYIEVPRE